MKRKTLCPLCGGRLFDADSTMELAIHPLIHEEEIKNAFYIKCSKCGNVCAVTPYCKRFHKVKSPSEDQGGIVVPIKAVLFGLPNPIEIKLNIVYSVQS